MSLIYTNNSSGAIRKARRKKPTKAYLEALSQHIKYLRTLGFKVQEDGRIIFKKREVINTTFKEAPTIKEKEIPLSNSIGNGGTKPDNRWKIEASKNWTIVPAYNKGPYMVVSNSDLKTAGKKV
ncbi:MAG: hypothetical protein CMA64_10720 [Euryarchaeota archaeon]|nr:hypothetical protein [Euryarchaeota archaeon]|tara:strand:+ start:232 stop:603 length:372 start_codon:yes stop_codon:yes gene_type:complete